MYANVASGVLIVIGAVFAVLGLFGAQLVVSIIGLLAIFGGGLLSIVAGRSRA